LILVLKVNNDLERMGDQVVNIAERLIFLVDQKRVVADLDILRMGEICSKMVHGVLQALVHGNVVAARKILAMDDDLDATDRVNMPDPDFAPLLAARFAAEALARDTLQPRRKVRLIQTLVPLAISNPTTLDTILARLLLADPRNDKLATVLTEAAVRIRPELAHPDYDRFLDSLAYAASQLGPT